jgi:hypothetical protein
MVLGSNSSGGNFPHPSSLLYNGNWVSFPRLKWPGCGVNHPPLLSVKLTKSTAIPLLPLSAFMACSRVNFTFTYPLFRFLFWSNDLDAEENPNLSCSNIRAAPTFQIWMTGLNVRQSMNTVLLTAHKVGYFHISDSFCHL